MRKLNMKLGGLCIAAASAVACMGMSFNALADSSAVKKVDSSNRTALLGVADPDSYFLGIASQFSVFVLEDFKAIGSDCEGRLAAGGNANMGEISYDYSVGAKLDENSAVAHVVVGGDTLRKFQPNGKNFVVGEAKYIDSGITSYAEMGQCNIYEGQLIDFDKEFALLNERSRWLASQPDNATLEINPHYTAGWTVRGSDPKLNILTLTAEQVEEFNELYVEFSIYIPDGSYLVINVEGDAHVDMPGNELTFFNEDGSVRKVDETQIPVLYNLADATSFKYLGSLFGSTLAPNADGSGDEIGHIAGATFAKSFDGGIEFGYTFFNMGMMDNTDSSVSTTTTEEAATTVATAVSAENETATTKVDDSSLTDENSTEASTETTVAAASDTQDTSGSTSTTSTETTSATTTGSGSTGDSPATGDAATGSMFVLAGVAALGMVAVRKRK